MAYQRWRKVKRDPNDDLYSRIIRYDQTKCWKCWRVRPLQAAHIVGRGRQSVRYELYPIPNAIPLCATCHDWFDSHKCADILFNKALQEIPQPGNSYYFLVKVCGYSWDQVERLYMKGNATGTDSIGYRPARLIKKHLSEVHKKQEAGYDIYAQLAHKKELF